MIGVLILVGSILSVFAAVKISEYRKTRQLDGVVAYWKWKDGRDEVWSAFDWTPLRERGFKVIRKIQKREEIQ